eukprot:9040096-Ditylum_brightwellii.AAC.1
MPFEIIQQVKDMAKQQLQPDDLEFTDIYGVPIISLDKNSDRIAGVDDAIVEETIKHHDAPNQLVEHEEIYDSSKPSEHTSPSITQPQQMAPASTEINNETIIKEESNTISETAGVSVNKEENKDN